MLTFRPQRQTVISGFYQLDKLVVEAQGAVGFDMPFRWVGCKF